MCREEIYFYSIWSIESFYFTQDLYVASCFFLKDGSSCIMYFFICTTEGYDSDFESLKGADDYDDFES